MENDNNHKNTANLIITCPDKPWIIRAVTDFIFVHWGNISLLEEHSEDGQFFMRIEWDLEKFKLQSEKEFLQFFFLLKEEFNMQINLNFEKKKKKIWLFCSKEWHCILDIISRTFLEELDIEIIYVISNSTQLQDVVEKFWIPFFYTPTKKDSLEHEQQQLKIIKKYPTDLIVLAKYMKILSADFIGKTWQKIINVHHSFLPSFVWSKPYQEAYERGVKLIWATSHYVIPELDQGPIIEQQVKRVKHCHSIENLKILGRECEKEVFATAIRKHIENKLIVYKNRTIVFE